MAHAIGIDVGTSNVKVGLVDPDGEILATAARPIETWRVGDAVEQDAEGLWEAVADAVAQVVLEAPRPGADVAAIGICSQYSSTVPVDARGIPTAPLITYFDQRGTDRCYAVMAEHAEAFEVFCERHGVPPIGSGLSLGHILHVLHDRPDLAERTAAYLEPMDYVAARLTGRIAATQATMFTSQVCDNRTLGVTAYDEQLCALAGVPLDVLPPLLAPGEPVGTLLPEVAERLGLPTAAIVATPMNDSHAGALATGACTPGRVGLMIGTTAVLLDDVDHLVADFDHEVLSMPSPVPDTYLVWAENGIAGKAIDHLLEHVIFATDELADHRHSDRFANLDATAGAVPAGSNGVLFLPWLAGAMAPNANRHMRGGFVNLSLDTSRRDLVRSMLEGTAHNLAWLLPVVESASGTRADHIVFGGGAARSTVWAQILADVLDRPILPLVDPHHAIARCVALAAVHGVAAMAEPASMATRTAPAYDPDPANRAIYDELNEQFVATFEALRPIYETLNR